MYVLFVEENMQIGNEENGDSRIDFCLSRLIKNFLTHNSKYLRRRAAIMGERLSSE